MTNRFVSVTKIGKGQSRVHIKAANTYEARSILADTYNMKADNFVHRTHVTGRRMVFGEY
ncbi:hypothetical protein ACU3L3_07490 [Priestia endophytica]